MIFLGLVSLFACRRPPEAPAGLDDSARYLYRNFYADDETISAGLTGLMDWYDQDGDELLGEKADLESVGAFSLTELDEADIAQIPMEGSPDPAQAYGVVALAEMACRWDEAEALLVRSDQDVVFDGSFDTYGRTYETARASFEAATASGDFEAVKDAIDPTAFAEVDPATVLLTRNAVQTTEFGVTIPFELFLHFRHGVYTIQGEEAEAFLILGYVPRKATSEGGDNSLVQNYSIEVNAARGGKTLRVFANWNELESSLVSSDSALVLSSAVNKAQDSAQRLSEICAGSIDIPGE